MTTVLTQEEVDALLSAIQEGKEIKADLVAERFRPKRPVVPYNFRKPDRISKEQIRYLQMLHDRFARNLSSVLSAYVRTIVDVTIASIEQITYQEFLMFLPGVSLYCVLNVNPDIGRIALNIDPELTFVMIDKLLGGPGVPPPDIRPFTDLEMDLLDGILARIIAELEKVWETLVEGVEFEIELKETTAGLVQIVAPNEVVVVITFEVKMGDFKGNLSLCIPSIALEPVSDKLVVEKFTKERHMTEDILNRIVKHLMELELEVECVVGHVMLTVGEFLSVESGDLLKLDTFADSHFVVTVEGKPKFVGKGGSFRGRKAVLVSGYTVFDREG